MTDIGANCTNGPASQAARILQAWKRRDETAFHREVAMTLNLPAQAGPYVLEEQTEVLKTVVTRLERCPELLSQGPTRPDGRACFSLLSHLASQA